MAWTRSRPRGRENARPVSGGPAAEHATTIYSIAIASMVAIVAFLALTSTGHVIDAATQSFMLYYAGVFALIALCASVALGLIATDRMILQPGHRIFVQSAHRAASFGAVAFLVIHITTEILAQRVRVLDAVVPFLSPFRTFYIGLGTIASDLVVLLVITGILRKRFTGHGKAWRWRAIHYTSYVAFVFGVWHGLLSGRSGKPYVDWSYGFVVALVALGLAVRILANSLRPKENLSSPPVAESAASGSAPMRAASMFAQLGIARAASRAVLETSAPQAILSARADGWTASQIGGPAPALAALPAPPGPYGSADDRQPLYEPGYEGPPRYLGAPRKSNTGPQPRANSGPLPRANSGPMARATTGAMPPVPGGSPRGRGGPRPGAVSGPMPPMPGSPGIGRGTGPLPRAASGPMPRAATGPMPRAQSGPMPAAGPMPSTGRGRIGGRSVPGAGAVPPAPARPRRRQASGPMPGAGGQMPSQGSPVVPGGPVAPGGLGGQPGGARRGGAHRSGGQPAGRNARGQARPPRPQESGWTGTQGWEGAPGWDGEAGVGYQDFGQSLWEGGAFGSDADFGYPEPEQGMPGYRGPGDRFYGDDLR